MHSLFTVEVHAAYRRQPLLQEAEHERQLAAGQASHGRSTAPVACVPGFAHRQAASRWHGTLPNPVSQPASSLAVAGVRVLDLTRVLAGPVATRFLAGLGADVLRSDPPDWDEPGLVPEATPGKRCARLDLPRGEHRQQFSDLLRSCDVLVRGYQPDALGRLGLGRAGANGCARARWTCR